MKQSEAKIFHFFITLLLAVSCIWASFVIDRLNARIDQDQKMLEQKSTRLGVAAIVDGSQFSIFINGDMILKFTPPKVCSVDFVVEVPIVRIPYKPFSSLP